MNMERIAMYLEKLGYTSEIQGGIKQYLLLFKQGVPVGFVLTDHSIALVDKTDEQKLTKIINFVKEHEGFELVGVKEYLLATYMGSQLTTYFDCDTAEIRYVVYTTDAVGGEVKPRTYLDPYEAKLDFVINTQMLNPDDVKKGSGKLKNRLIDKLVDYLMEKRNAK